MKLHAAAAVAIAIACLAPTLSSAQADTPAPVAAPAPAPAPAPAAGSREFRGLLGAALTYGGEEIASVPLSDGTTARIRAGGLIDLWGGAEWRPQGGPFAVQATVGYHVDCVCARNGDITFSRMPVELIGLYEFAPRWRAGAGYRHTSSVRLRSSGAAPGYAQDFDDANGFLVQGEWLATQRLGVVVRFVSERYGYTQTYVNANDQIVAEHLKKDGSHGGVGINWYF
jgi:hypothetical protein